MAAIFFQLARRCEEGASAPMRLRRQEGRAAGRKRAYEAGMVPPMESRCMTLYRVNFSVPPSELHMEPMLPRWMIVVLAIYVVIDSIAHPGKQRAPMSRRRG
jgi:hypothetical protein